MAKCKEGDQAMTTPSLREQLDAKLDTLADEQLAELLDYLEAMLADDLATRDEALRVRYRRMTAELSAEDHTEMVKKLEASARRWDEELVE
jgi:putative hemolysin